MRIAIKVKDLHKQYGSQVLFDEAAVEIAEDHRIALIGRNGAGKSTFLRILLGEDEADNGTVELHAGIKFGVIRQNDPFLDGETVQGYLERSSGKPGWRCGEVAGRFLLGPDLLTRPVGGLSGGWQTRARLTAMLLAEPDFLLLDEPTNYLDLRTLVLLERFLTDFRGGWIIVSHDRQFLINLCDRTLEAEHGRLTFYPGRVDQWLTRKSEQREQAEQINATLAVKKKQLAEFVARNKARASTAARAQSAMKHLEKLDDQAIDIDNAPDVVSITMSPVEHRPGWALKCDDLAVGYGHKRVAGGIQLDLERGERFAVLGDNGQGKTTFLRTVAGHLPAVHGGFRWATGLRIGIYAQDVFAAFPPTRTVFDHLDREARGGNGPAPAKQLILDVAGAFLFRGDAIEKKVGVLSGGERARLCLAGLVLGRYQVLLLDEPTNHLDVESVEAFAAALATYKGTVLFTCHDRGFSATVSTKLIEVADAKVQLFPGSYDQYVAMATASADGAAMAPKKDAVGNMAASGAGPTPQRLDQQARRELQKQLKAVERSVQKLDAEKRQLDGQLGAAYDAALAKRRDEVAGELARAEEQWLELSGRIGE